MRKPKIQPVPTSKTLIDRLMRYAQKGETDDECWKWTGSRAQGGYGRIRLSRKLEVRAHRLSFAIHYDIDPGSKEVCHTCDNPECTNPKHLFLGTHLHNMQDASRKGRFDGKGRGISRNVGENNGRAKLTNEDVRSLIAEYHSSGLTQRDLGAKWGISQATISQIICGYRRKGHTVDTGCAKPPNVYEE